MRPITRRRPPRRYEHVVWIWMENKPVRRGRRLVRRAVREPARQAVRPRDELPRGHAPEPAELHRGDLRRARTGSPTTTRRRRIRSAWRASTARSRRRGRRGATTRRARRQRARSPRAAVRREARSRPRTTRASAATAQRRDVPLGTTAQRQLPAADLTNGTLPAFSFVTPNLCDDTHDCSVATGDAWLKSWFAKILASPTYPAGRHRRLPHVGRGRRLGVESRPDDRRQPVHAQRAPCRRRPSTHYSLLKTSRAAARDHDLPRARRRRAARRSMAIDVQPWLRWSSSYPSARRDDRSGRSFAISAYRRQTSLVVPEVVEVGVQRLVQEPQLLVVARSCASPSGELTVRVLPSPRCRSSRSRNARRSPSPDSSTSLSRGRRGGSLTSSRPASGSPYERSYASASPIGSGCCLAPPAEQATSLHPEDAEGRLGNRRVQRGRDAEREHAARVERVDDAVVPQARGRVVRVALLLVLRADLRRGRRRRPSSARSPPGRRPSRRCARSATSRAGAARTRGRTSRSCRRRTSRR